MSFESWSSRICDRFVSQRTFDLVVVPALADLEFEEAAGRRSRIASRAAVLRAIAGGVGHDMRRGSGGFLKLALLSAATTCFRSPCRSAIFRTWSDFFCRGDRDAAAVADAGDGLLLAGASPGPPRRLTRHAGPARAHACRSAFPAFASSTTST